MACDKKIPLKDIQTEVIVIDDSDSRQCINTKEIHKTKKRKHRKDKRKVHIDTSSNSETLVITQKVQVRKKRIKKQKIQCIINLSNIGEHTTEKKKSQKMCTDRIVPHCLRQNCQSEIDAKYYKMRQSERSKSKTHRKQSLIERKRLGRNSSVKYLSPISSSSIVKYLDSDLYYEDISSGSFTTASDELETLIKRTKDREKRLSKTCHLNLPLHESTPKHTESISDSSQSAILRCSEVDTSFHSTATFVLEPRTEVYSPTNPTMSPNITDACVTDSEQNFDIKPYQVVLGENTDGKEYKQYSPAINYYDIYKQEYQYPAHVKKEPFSPTLSSINDYLGKLEHSYEGAYEVSIKFENSDYKSSMNRVKTVISRKSLAGQEYDNSSIKQEQISVEENIPLKHEKY